MFYLNLASQWGSPNVGDHGVCLAAFGVNSFQGLNRDGVINLPPPDRRLFDPQLYLRELDYDDCIGAVSKLATYPWFNPDVSEKQDGETQKDWQDRMVQGMANNWPTPLPTDPEEISDIVQACLEYQLEFGVGGLILPTPLITDPENDYSEDLMWVDRGLNVELQDSELPRYVTIAISDVALLNRDPRDSELRQIIMDQVTAREEVDGVYLLIEQSAPLTGTYITNSRIAWHLLSFCYDLGVRAEKKVILNYADTFGIACVAAGASGFCSAPPFKGRRLSFSDYEVRGGGGALPKFYSNELILDLYPERDIEDKIVPINLARLIVEDRTSSSETLFAALDAGDPVNLIPDWREGRNNITNSSSHYIERVIGAYEELLATENKLDYVLEWLQDAERDAGYLNERLKEDPIHPDHRHIRAWRKAFVNFRDQYNI